MPDTPPLIDLDNDNEVPIVDQVPVEDQVFNERAILPFELSDLVRTQVTQQANAAARRTRSGNWQMSITRPGEYVEGIAAIEESMWIVLNTRLGSQPFNPQFGSEALFELDKPLNIAAPLAAAAIKRDLTRWVSRVTIDRVSYTFQNSYGETGALVSGVIFTVVWRGRGDLSNEQRSDVFGVSPESVGVDSGFYFILATETGQFIETETGENIRIA